MFCPTCLFIGSSGFWREKKIVLVIKYRQSKTELAHSFKPAVGWDYHHRPRAPLYILAGCAKDARPQPLFPGVSQGCLQQATLRDEIMALSRTKRSWLPVCYKRSGSPLCVSKLQHKPQHVHRQLRNITLPHGMWGQIKSFV